MYSRFPFSMENIPRQRSFGCLTLKFASIVTALVVILYSVLALSQGFAELNMVTPEMSTDDVESMVLCAFIITTIIIHAVTFLLTAFMLIGSLRDKKELIKPWVVWMSALLIVSVLSFMFTNTMGMIHQFNDTSLLIFAIEFITILIRFYMLVLVASFYKQLQDESQESERLKKLINTDTWYTEA